MTRSGAEDLKYTNNAWHTRKNGLLLRSTKKFKLSHSVKNALCSSSYFRFAVHFSFAIITKIYKKLKNANIISLSTCTKNTTGRFLQNQAADRRNKACEKEPHETRQRAACGSRASGWPPLVYKFQKYAFIEPSRYITRFNRSIWGTI